MSRATGLALAALGAVLAGCGDQPRSAVAPAAPAVGGTVTTAPLAPVIPAVFQGTWRGEGGEFLAIGAESVVFNLAKRSRRPARPTEVTVIGADSAAISLDQGLTLVVAVGRAMQTRTIGHQDVVAECPMIDLGIEGPGDTAALRLWKDTATTWFPVAPAPVLVQATPPAVLPEVATPSRTDTRSPDTRFLAAATEVGDDRLLAGTKELLEQAAAGARPQDLEAAALEVLRRQRLAALDLLEKAGAGDVQALAAADRAIAQADAWLRTCRSWLGSRG